jgi:hypothetical protein
MDATLERNARWLAERPGNRPGADKSWVLDAMWAALRFDAERARAERVRGR